MLRLELTTISVTPLVLETRFSQLEVQRIQQEAPNDPQKTGVELLFTEQYNPVREMAVQPEASQELRKQIMIRSSRANVVVRPVSQSVTMARAIQAAQLGTCFVAGGLGASSAKHGQNIGDQATTVSGLLSYHGRTRNSRTEANA